MDRIFFRFLPPYRAPRGGPIIDLQKGLAAAGDFPLAIDGVFANQTTQALRLWQMKSGMAASGAVDSLSWVGLTRTSEPSLFRRCLGLTAAFEGQGYTLAVGNFDGAGLTWGIVGFTLVTGDLAKVLKLINARAPQTMTTVFGPALGEVMEILDATKAKKLAWANSVSLGADKSGLRADLKDAFETLGNQQVARDVQDGVAHDDYWKRAVSDLGEFGKPTELDAAIFFDTAVQNGGVGGAKAAAVKATLQNAPPTLSTRERLNLIVPALAIDVNPKYADDVLSRRGAIATGVGSVHGATYKLTDWGLDDLAVSPTDLL